MDESFLNAEGAKDSQKSLKREDGISHAVIGAAVEVQRVLGTGLLESAYAAALAVELRERGLSFEREVPVPASYKGQMLGVAFRADFLVERCVLLELKAVELLTELHRAQLLSYLRVSDLRLGLLINFHTFPVVKGVKRVVNQL
ncbi:GxxExxY protein [Ottowia sp. SB7-C50]|uniref:GxxExxY protein n=1 Tax=Ottowia sp. SB7-C50 TaxID=3081231 RepID=UPI002952C434|nr:GxxExxY protein [Ottowia sp. SB7-C50]WOP15832.1 GxxExxY protein [Ottowia sp. SB7-C50]